MNVKNLIISSLAGGAVSLIAVNVPFLNLVNCLVCIGFWGSAVLAVWLYQRMTGSVTLGQAVVIGMVTGLWAGVIGFGLSFIGLAGGAALANSIKMVSPDAKIDIPGGSGVLFNLCGVGVDIAFGALGGLIGGALFRNRK